MIVKNNNVLKVTFEHDRILTSPLLWQHDKGQILQFTDIPDGTQVEFANKNHERAEPYIVQNSQVKIPDFLLKENSQITAYVKVVDENSETTVKTITIPVLTRPQSDDGVPPENQQTFRQQIQKIMDSTQKTAQSVRDDADNGKFKGDKGEPGKDGKDYILTDEDKDNITERLLFEKEWQLFNTYEADGTNAGYIYTAQSGFVAKEVRIVGHGLTFADGSNINFGFRTSANASTEGHKQLVFINAVSPTGIYQLRGLMKRIEENQLLVSLELWSEKSVATTNVLRRQFIFTDDEIIKGNNIVYLCFTMSSSNKINAGIIKTYTRGRY